MRFSITTSALTLLSATPTLIHTFTIAPPATSFRPTSSFSRTPSSLRAKIDVSEQAQRNVAPLGEWATRGGVQKIDGFTLSSQDGLDIFAATAVDLKAGQPILGVPAQMVLTTSKSKMELTEKSSGGVAAAVTQLVNYGAAESIPQFYLFLKVLSEYDLGEQSKYYPWLDSLPRLFYNSVSMTDFCLECLPPLVFRLSRVERSKFDNMYNALQKVDVISAETKADKEVCKWAFNVVNTRSFGSDTEKWITPMADMFNHGTETEVEVKFDDGGNCRVFTTRDVPAKTPLRMRYGCPTNPSYFFATYGFLDKSSPGSFCKIMDIQSTPELVALGYDHSKMLFYKDTGDISQEVWDVVLYSKVLSKNIDAQKAFYEAHVKGDGETKKKIHQMFLSQTAGHLKGHVDSFLMTLDVLDAKADGKDIKDHPRLPLILSHNAFVRGVFQKVKARLDPMVEQLAQQGVPA